jgi:hypothetical protein
MALITDPDNLSQGLETAVSDAAFTSSSGATTTITSAANLPTLVANDYFEVRDHSTPGNNGLYIATGSPTASSLPCTKVDGVDPTDAGAEAIRTFGDNGAASEYKSVHIDVDQNRLYLLEQGSLSTDGVTLQALYSFLKEEWKADSDLIQNAFPIVSITPEQFEFSSGWVPQDVTSPAIQTRKLIRTAGWSEIDTTDSYINTQYTGIITLGTFEDDAADTAYYQLGNDPTDTAATTDFTFAGPVNEAILTYEDVGVPGDITVTGTNTINSAGSDFVADGFRVGGSVTVQNANTPANDGTWVITSVSTTALVVSGTLTNDAGPDTTMQLAVDNRNAVQVFLRVRDADPNGKTFDKSTVQLIGFDSVDNKAFRFPLSNATDLNISESDANIGSNSPYTEVRVRYLDATYNREVDTTTKRDFGIVIDVGTYSESNGASATSTLFTSANLSLGAGEALADYAGGTLYIHEGTDQGTHTISGTPVDNAGTLEITLTVALTATESNLSFTMERASPLTATKTEIYEKVQYLLRQAADIDSTDATVSGDTADELLEFVGSDLLAGSKTPSNPNGGGSGVIIEGFDSNDTNNLFFYDNVGTKYNYPYVAAGSITFNINLTGDSDPDYWMFFEYTIRTTVTDFAISAATGSDASFDSSGAGLPTVAQWDYVRLTDMTNPENNGIWVVTDASPTASQFDARKVDSQIVVNEGAASHFVDQYPIDSPQAIVVNNNAGSPIQGAASSSPVAFDFDYDGNSQGSRTPGTNANIVIRAIGLETGQFAQTLGTIQRATGQAYSVVAALERNYQNP